MVSALQLKLQLFVSNFETQYNYDIHRDINLLRINKLNNENYMLCIKCKNKLIYIIVICYK